MMKREGDSKGTISLFIWGTEKNYENLNQEDQFHLGIEPLR
jgi:hypothetical protein